MRVVTAYSDDRDRLFKTPQAAINADFIALVKSAYNRLPAQDKLGDPEILASLLTGDTYAAARHALLDALQWYEKQINDPLNPIDLPD